MKDLLCSAVGTVLAGVGVALLVLACVPFFVSMLCFMLATRLSRGRLKFRTVFGPLVSPVFWRRLADIIDGKKPTPEQQATTDDEYRVRMMVVDALGREHDPEPFYRPSPEDERMADEAMRHGRTIVRVTRTTAALGPIEKRVH